MTTLPVKKVVVMEDRAQVERRGTPLRLHGLREGVDGIVFHAGTRGLTQHDMENKP